VARLVEELGRAAQLKIAHGVPAHVLPVALWHTASTGVDLWLSAVAFGASQIVVLVTSEEAPQYLDGLEAQMAVAQAILNGLGYAGTHLKLLRARNPTDLDAGLQALSHTRQTVPSAAARFAVAQEKRSTLELALDHLIAQAPMPAAQRPEAIALPAAGAPLGTITVNKDRCTLCLSCVSACPASALQDNPQLPSCVSSSKTVCSAACAPPPALKAPLRCSRGCCSRPGAASCACSTKPSPGPVCVAANPSAP
jgi:4Fe-4S binding domain.